MAFDPQDVARALREHRTAAGLTQAELAEKAGLAFETISRLESGREPPSLRSAVALADALGASLDALVQRPAPPAARRDKLTPEVRRLVASARGLEPKMMRHLVAVVDGLKRASPKAKRGAKT